MLYDMQAGQAVTAGYFGGYSAKMQDIGAKELQRVREARANVEITSHRQISHPTENNVKFFP